MSETGVHSSAVGNESRPSVPTGNQEYPEMKHAGKVGYGPNFHSGPTAGEKMSGYKEELMGKIKKNPDLVHHGHDMRTGELQRKEKEADDADDPFANPEEKKKGSSPDISQEHQQSSTVAPEGTESAEQQRRGGNTDNVKNIGADY